MDEEEVLAAENLELRISEMKAQFQQSYDVFIKAHEELSKISFDSSTIPISCESLGPLSKLQKEDVNEIVSAGSIDQCISMLRSKVPNTEAEHPSTFPDVTKLLSIMSGLQLDIESLTENQKQFSKLTEDVNNEMSMIEKRIENSVQQIGDLVVESLDSSESSQQEDDFFEDIEEEETFGSESLSD